MVAESEDPHDSPFGELPERGRRTLPGGAAVARSTLGSVRILLYGLTGYTGVNIAREAAARGHEVIGVARHSAEGELPEGVTAVVGDVRDAETARAWARDVDAILMATQPLLDDGGTLLDALPGLLAAAESSGARLGYIGGAASLHWEEGGPMLLDLGFPEEWKPAARVHVDVLRALRESDTTADWFFLSPPEIYGSHTPGTRTGAYRLGTDLAVQDSRGRSRIGGEDLAIAVLDELETPRHHRMRFTVGY
ncbi:MAG: NAD(P)H-binding protein [Actinomycetales bacterium]|nr:NAD(P)H-binding protein [Actinomycetales bacterium]